MAKENTPTLGDAMSAAFSSLEEGAAPVVETPPEGEQAPPEGEQAPPEGEQAPPEGETETEGGEGEDDVDTETVQPDDAVAPDGYVRDPETGRFAKKPAEAEGAAAAAAPAAKPAAKEPDHVNDPIDPKLHERTRERIESLANKVKETAPIVQAYDELMGHITDTGMSSNEFGQMLQYSKLVHSTDPADLRKAYTFLNNELQGLAKTLGETLPGGDPLEDHPDLQELVKTQKTTPELAAEVAQNRNRTAATTKITTQVQTTEQANQAFAAAAQKAAAGLNTLSDQLKISDPDYARKYPIVIATLKSTMKHAPPAQWVSIVKEAFTNLVLPKAAAPAAAAAVVPRVAGQQPLRANKQPAGGGKKQASSMSEAMNGAIDGAGR